MGPKETLQDVREERDMLWDRIEDIAESIDTGRLDQAQEVIDELLPEDEEAGSGD